MAPARIWSNKLSKIYCSAAALIAARVRAIVDQQWNTTAMPKPPPARAKRKVIAATELQRGGRRNGAGRKPLDAASERVMLTLTAAQIAGLRAEFPDLPLATASREAIDRYLQKRR